MKLIYIIHSFIRRFLKSFGSYTFITSTWLDRVFSVVCIEDRWLLSLHTHDLINIKQNLIHLRTAVTLRSDNEISYSASSCLVMKYTRQIPSLQLKHILFITAVKT